MTISAVDTTSRYLLPIVLDSMAYHGFIRLYPGESKPE